MRFTDRSIAAIKPKAERFEVWEDNRTGLGLRVSPRGRKSWIFMYRFDGRARRMTLGTYPVPMGLADARIAHGQAQKALELGTDPGAAKVQANVAERAAETVSEIISIYMQRHGSRKRTGIEDERVLRKEVEPHWGRRRVASINRRDVIALLDRIEDRDAPYMRNRTLSVIQSMFGVALDRGIVDATPCARIKRLPEIARERALSDDEVRTLWTALDGDAIEVSRIVRLAIKWLLCTGVRRGAVAGAQRDEITETEDGLTVWTVPVDRVKATRASARRTHVVPLSGIALDLLKEIDGERAAIAAPKVGRQEPKPISPYLFPSPQRDTHIGPDSISQAIRVHRDAMGIQNIRAHDLRRTVDTHLGSLGFTRFDRDRVLGHTDRSIGGRHYDQWTYLPEKRRALDAWGARLTEIISGNGTASNVVRLPSAG